MVGRGGSYSPEEDTALARSWVSVSTQHDEQNAIEFWGSVASIFVDQPEVDAPRIGESLRCCWGTLQRIVQKYLAAERQCEKNPVSRETSEDVKAKLMRLYRARTKKADKTGVVREDPPLRSVGAVDILLPVPKFSGVVGCGEDCELDTDS
eukprot:IDg20168t1